MFNEANGGSGQDRPGHAEALNLLARARPEGLKALAESLLDGLGEITVITNRTGLVMVPMRDTVENVDFHLGEVLVSEAQIADPTGHIGYGMVTGRDLEHFAMQSPEARRNLNNGSAGRSDYGPGNRR